MASLIEKEIRASDIACWVQGSLTGDDVCITGVAPVNKAGLNDLSFICSKPPHNCSAGLLLSSSAWPGYHCIVVSNPRAAFAVVLARLFPEVHLPQIYAGAFVHPSAMVGKNVTIYPGVWVGPHCQVGADTILFPNVVLYAHTIIGQRCRIHAGTVLWISQINEFFAYPQYSPCPPPKPMTLPRSNGHFC